MFLRTITFLIKDHDAFLLASEMQQRPQHITSILKCCEFQQGTAFIIPVYLAHKMPVNETNFGSEAKRELEIQSSKSENFT